MITYAQWPDSEHIVPHPIAAGDNRILINGRRSQHPCRLLTEDEYQLLLAGFKAAGGKIAT